MTIVRLSFLFCSCIPFFILLRSQIEFTVSKILPILPWPLWRRISFSYHHQNASTVMFCFVFLSRKYFMSRRGKQLCVFFPLCDSGLEVKPFSSQPFLKVILMWRAKRVSRALHNGFKPESRRTIKLLQEQVYLLSNRWDTVWRMIWQVLRLWWDVTVTDTPTNTHKSTYTHLQPPW